MNEFEPTRPPADVSDQIAALQRQIFTLLLALIVVSGTLVAYLYYQSRVLGQNIAIDNQQIQPIEDTKPAFRGFVDQLRAYGVTNPDFADKVLKKYQIPPPAAPKK